MSYFYACLLIHTYGINNLYSLIKLSSNSPLSPHPHLCFILLSFLKLDHCAHLMDHLCSLSQRPTRGPVSYCSFMLRRKTGWELLVQNVLCYFHHNISEMVYCSIKEIQLFSRILFLNHKNIFPPHPQHTHTQFHHHYSVIINLFKSELKIRGKITFIYKHVHTGIQCMCR